MRVGLYFDLRNPAPWPRPFTDVYRRALDLCTEADRRGIGGLWFSEHHLFVDGYLPQPLTFASAAAARTSRARIGTAVVLPALRAPAHLAEEAAVVDIISDGRLELGLGAGYRKPEFDLFGADFAARNAATDASVALLRHAWTEGAIKPEPVQRPIPLWLGYGGPKGAARAAKLGTGLLSLNQPAVAAYLAAWSEAGHDPSAARVGGLVNMFVTDDPERAWPIVRPHLEWQWDTYNRYWAEATGRRTPPPIDADAWRCRHDDRPPRFLLGTPDDALQHIREMAGSAPVTDVLVWADIAGLPDDLVDQQLELITGTLVPALHPLE